MNRVSRAAGGMTLALALLASPLRAQDEPPPAVAVRYEVEVTGVEDDALRTLLTESSSLVGLKDEAPPSVLGLERRAEADRERLQTALRSAGYYDARLDVRVDDTVQPVKVTVAVEPGPAYTFKTIAVATADGRPLPGGPVDPKDLGLVPGERARAPQVVAAEGELTGKLATLGHPFAKVADRRAVVDHNDRTMDVTYTVDAGPTVRFGETRVEGLDRVDEDLVRGRLAWKPGDRFDPAELDKTRQELAQLGVFDTVRVTLAPEPGPDGVTPVVVTLAERDRRFIGAGILFSTQEGFGAQAYWGHRNLFGGAEQLRLSFEVGRLGASSGGSSASGIGGTDFRFGANFRKPDFLARRQTLVLDASAVSDNPPAYERNAFILSAGLERKLTDTITVSAGLASEQGEIYVTDRTYRTSLIGVPLVFIYDGTDSLLNPTRGFRASVQTTPWFPAGGDTQSPFLVNQVVGSTYYDIRGDGRYVAAARLGVGSITGTTLGDIPPDKRFYAGGGGSVRGYGFQLVGPRDRENDPIGGRALLEVGLELRIKVTETIGVVPFLDAGTVYDRAFPDFSEPLRYGAGLGLRYYTDFGPLRVDVGIPLNPQRGDSRWQLYLSLGQAF